MPRQLYYKIVDPADIKGYRPKGWFHREGIERTIDRQTLTMLACFRAIDEPAGEYFRTACLRGDDPSMGQSGIGSEVMRFYNTKRNAPESWEADGGASAIIHEVSGLVQMLSSAMEQHPGSFVVYHMLSPSGSKERDVEAEMAQRGYHLFTVSPCYHGNIEQAGLSPEGVLRTVYSYIPLAGLLTPRNFSSQDP